MSPALCRELIRDRRTGLKELLHPQHQRLIAPSDTVPGGLAVWARAACRPSQDWHILLVSTGPIWECAVGDGALVDALTSAGRTVLASDVRRQRYGFLPLDYLKTTLQSRRKAQ